MVKNGRSTLLNNKIGINDSTLVHRDVTGMCFANHAHSYYIYIIIFYTQTYIYIYTYYTYIYIYDDDDDWGIAGLNHR